MLQVPFDLFEPRLGLDAESLRLPSTTLADVDKREPGIYLACLLLAALLTACTPGVVPSSSTTADTAPHTTSPTSIPEATTTTQTPQARWIDISGEQFVDTRSGEPFVPIGVNLLLKTGGGGPDRLFEVYDPVWVDTQLDGITALGFNTVRFFLDMCMQCTSTSEGIRDDYLDNLADLLTRLESHGLVALPTSNDVPDPGFSERLPCCEPFGGYRNSLYLSSEGHRIAVEYWTELIDGLHSRGAPTHHLLGWQLANEQFVLRDVPPINLTEGTVVTADGVEYDLSDDAAVAEMVVSNLRQYLTTVGDVIRGLDEGALINMGFFAAENPDEGRLAADNRWVVPDQIVESSTLDFVDLHAYPGFGASWDSIATAYRLTENPPYPLLLGEFGAFEDAYPDPEDAAAATARWQVGSCDLGFDGWLLWFWGADRDDEVITADAHDRVVGQAISPLNRPDPCELGDYASANLALDRPVTASAEENDEYGAPRAVDGSDATWWSAAEGPPQWIEIDLEEDRTVGRVELLIGHVSPSGPQTHRVYVRGVDDPSPGVLAGQVSADARHGDWLTVEFEPVPGVRFVRVETVAMDGWVIIHEISVLSD